MKPTIKHLSFLAAGLGILAAGLRLGYTLFGRDAKDLLILWHPLDLLIWAVTIAMVVLTVLAVRKTDLSDRYEDNFGPSAYAAIGCTALTGGILSAAMADLGAFSRLEVIRCWLGLLSAPALFWLGICRIQGKRPFFGFHALPCLYLTIHTVSHYQAWCARPLVQDFFFPMAASILLALFAYCQAAFDVDLGKGKTRLSVGLLGSFACLAASVSEDMTLYLGGALWMLTSLCPSAKPETIPTEKE